MEFVVLPLIWIVASTAIAVIAQRKGRSALWFFLLSMLLSPLLGIVVVLLAKSADDAQSEQEAEEYSEAKDVDPANAATVNLTPEEAEAMRIKVVERMQSENKHTTVSQNASTNVFSPEEMAEIQRAAKEEKK